MGRSEIAERADAARKALSDLAIAVRDLPPPAFNFARSVELLQKLADWAGYDRRGAFPETETLSGALEGGLEKACVDRQPPSQCDTELQSKRVAEPEHEAGPEKASVPPAGKSKLPRSRSRRQMAKQLGMLGGLSRSPEKIAAARQNMKVINEIRWAAKRRQQGEKET